jgi:hypothetical protein
MSIDPSKLVNLGNYANDGTGDDLRTAFEKVNQLFQELSGDVNIVGGTNLGGGAGIFAQKNLTNLEFKSLVSTDQSVAITSSSNTINLASTAKLSSDPNPTLTQDLDLNGKRIIDVLGTGDIQASVYGIHLPILNALVELIVASGSVDINLGTFQQPTGTNGNGTDHGINLDLGSFILPYDGNTLDFGRFV